MPNFKFINTRFIPPPVISKPIDSKRMIFSVFRIYTTIWFTTKIEHTMSANSRLLPIATVDNAARLK